MKKKIYLTVSALLIAAGVSWLEREPLAKKVRIKMPERLTLHKQAKETHPLKKIPREESSRIQENELDEFRRMLPRQEELNKEIRSNPHQTPPTLLLFAGRLGELMELAERNPADKKILLKELEACALGEHAAATVRALCLSSAEKLGHRHLQREVPSFIRNLVNQRNKMLIHKSNTKH